MIGLADGWLGDCETRSSLLAVVRAGLTEQCQTGEREAKERGRCKERERSAELLQVSGRFSGQDGQVMR